MRYQKNKTSTQKYRSLLTVNSYVEFFLKTTALYTKESRFDKRYDDFYFFSVVFIFLNDQK